ncbi:MAG: 2-hydroxy-3-oxopropionate reductase [Bifidobacteriaceae bacterium]|jgi:2-hydroxy-3-oxopropionate reductase|nr:2-hydroxy-3-oxopropionate reductase [Bifidobacteriaceae bacterium]
MRIGFIGLGIMGRPMAKNLVKAGHELVVCDHHEENTAALAALGAEVADSPARVAAGVELALTMLPDSPQVRQAALGAGGLAEGARAGLVYADMSSIDPLVAREVAAALAERGVGMLDAPVSGGEPFAVAGRLAFMVGGPAELFERVRPVFEAMGRSVTRVGEIGAGNIAKLANQAIVAVNIAVLAEALVLAEKAGVAPAAVVEAVQGGLAGSNVMAAKAPMILAHDFAPGFRVDLHHKDLANALATAHAVASPMPLTAAVFEQLSQLRALGWGGEDHSALARVREAAAGASLAGE